MMVPGVHRLSRAAAAVAMASTLGLALSGAAAAKATVSIWYMWSDPFAKEIVNRFNSTHSDITLRMETAFTNDKLMSAMAAGSPPNIVLHWNDYIPNMANRGLIIPLDAYTKKTRIKLGDYSRAAVDNATYKGKLFGIPLDWDPDFATMVNRKMFAEAGIDYRTSLSDLDDFAAMAEKFSVRQASGKYSKIGWIPWSGWQFWQTYFAGAFGGQFYDEAKTAVTMNHPKNVEAYRWLANYTGKYTYSALLNAGGFWWTGKQAILTSGVWSVTDNRKAAKFDYAVAPPPHPKGGKAFLPCSGWSFMIPKGAKDIDATMKVIEYLSDSWAAVEFCKQRSMLPANLKYRNDPRMTDDPFMMAFAKLSSDREDSAWVTNSPILPTIWAEAETAATLVVQQKKSAKDALDAAQKVAETDLKRAIARKLMK